MKLYLKELQTPGLIRSMYVVTAETDPKELWKSSAITILRESSTKSSVMEIIESYGLDKLVDEQKVILLFPNPVNDRWNYTLKEGLTKDAEFIIALNNSLNSGTFTEGWRAMNDVHYLLGFGEGASMVNTLVAAFPSGPLAAAVCTVGGVMADEALERAVNSPVPALIIDGDPRAKAYYICANNADKTNDENLYVCKYNPMQKVRVVNETGFSQELCKIMWEEFFLRIRRTNTTPEGQVDRRIIPEECNFIWHIKDTCLGDNGGLDHDWLEHVPESVKANPDKKVPLLIFSHGMSDNPLKAADMAKFHEIGEREGFITVYTYSSDRYRWNLSMSPDGYDDIAYYLALIDYLKKTYPVDETRIYLSGFSNGAGMAMTFAFMHPELIAAICPIDTTFPYANMQFFRPAGREKPFITEVLKPGQEPQRPFMPRENPDRNLAPLHEALNRQKTKPYRMPVMYFYGTRESEFPIRKGCNQQIQYDFWKTFNNIPVRETEDLEEGVGVIGDEVHELFPSRELPDSKFSHHVFYSSDSDRKDYYHFILAYGKAHDVHPSEPELGWAYVSRFSRNPDGSLNDSKK